MKSLFSIKNQRKGLTNSHWQHQVWRLWNLTFSFVLQTWCLRTRTGSLGVSTTNIHITIGWWATQDDIFNKNFCLWKYILWILSLHKPSDSSLVYITIIYDISLGIKCQCSNMVVLVIGIPTKNRNNSIVEGKYKTMHKTCHFCFTKTLCQSKYNLRILFPKNQTFSVLFALA